MTNPKNDETPFHEKIVEELSSIKNSEQMNELQANATSLAKNAVKWIRKHPVESVAGAAVLAFFAGAWINRRRD